MRILAWLRGRRSSSPQEASGAEQDQDLQIANLKEAARLLREAREVHQAYLNLTHGGQRGCLHLTVNEVG